MRWPQAQALSNAAWALATLGHVPPGGLLSQLAERAAAIIRTFRPQATSNTMCASSPLSPAARHCRAALSRWYLFCDPGGGSYTPHAAI